MPENITEEVVETMPTLLESLDGKSVGIGYAAGTLVTGVAVAVESKFHLGQKLWNKVFKKNSDVIDAEFSEVSK